MRCSGILLHPTSLPSKGGIGDFGPEAYAFLDFLADAKQGLWQILPLSPPGLGDSPYSAISAFAGNPLLVSLDRLVERGWIEEKRLNSSSSSSGGGSVSGRSAQSLVHDSSLRDERLPKGPRFASESLDADTGSGSVPGKLTHYPNSQRIDFEAVKAYKLPLLREAAQNFLQAGNRDRRRFENFKRENSWWLDDFVLFEVMREIYKGASWSTWPRGLARRDPEALRNFGLQYQRELEVERVIQFAFFEQWRALRLYASQRGIRIIGDVAIFVNYDSADVWRHPEMFYLDEDLQPTVVAGVPPDAFSATGQRWGNPLYRWNVCRATGYQWWVQRMSWALQNFDMVRLDHFRGFESFWEIPASEPTAVKGRWVAGPKDELFNVLRERLGDLPFIAEDLGMITPEVYALRDRLGIPGMKVLQFGFGDPGAHIYLPHNFPVNSVVYTGTHDNDTTVGWWKSFATEEEKRDAAAYIGEARDGIHCAFIRTAFASVARLAIVPLQDILGLDSDSRMNTPSRSNGNWGWRYQSGALTPDLAKKLATLASVSDRVAEVPATVQQNAEEFAA